MKTDMLYYKTVGGDGGSEISDIVLKQLHLDRKHLSTMATNIGGDSGKEMKGWRKGLKRVGNWMAHKDKDKWLKDMRGMLSLMATVIATMTFQSGINPPGGVLPAKDSGVDCQNDSCPGQSVLALVYTQDFKYFLYFNTICFVSSSAVCLLLVSGFPLKNRFFTWLMSIGMCIILSTLSLTYLFGAQMIVPDLLWDDITTMFGKVIIVWLVLLVLIAVFLSLRLIFWFVTKCMFGQSKVLQNPTI
ncbi:unnamed protein product [Sphenostylis stenocarpa]|uniref:PGG domain-containing protein n=1 Tax=Sphenostylis stenocarpa TaxID=92480 RepID=A0AA86SBU0_9FABA|nr:unnamed protein product [Sphenostylis stenocarpa]